MTIKQQGGVFGRNPTFNNVEVDGKLSGGDLRGDSLGVGVDSLSYQAEFAKAGSASYVMVNQTGATPSGLLIGAEGSKNSIYSGTGPGNLAGKSLAIYQGFTLVCSTTAAGNLAFPSGQGIDFSTTAGTGTSELFDDYEEGTWTPAFQTSNNNMTVTHDVQTGFYTKVGNVVTCTGRLRTDAVSGGTGVVQIQGLPFTAKSGAILGSIGVLSIGAADAWVAAPIGGYVNIGGTSLDLIKTGLTVITPADLTNAANSNGLLFSITYLTD